MARNTQKQATTFQPSAPEFLAWHVAQRGKKSFWNKVGAAWRHKDGHGLTLQLEMMSLGGRIVLRHPIEDPASPATETEKGA